MRWTFWFSVLACTLCCGRSTLADDALERIKAEYPGALARMESFFSRVKASGTVTLRSGARPAHFRAAVARDIPSMKVSLIALDLPGQVSQEKVFCYTADRTFSIFRKSEGRPYVLQDLGTPAESAVAKILVPRYLMAPCSTFGIPISKLMADPTFEIASVSKSSENGKTYYKITYNYGSAETMYGPGWIQVSPDEGWVIRKSAIEAFNNSTKPSKTGPEMFCEIDYKDSDAGFSLPTRVAYRVEGDRGDSFDFDNVSVGSIPAEEFTLAYYGLPEVGPSMQSSGRFYLFFALGLAALVLSIILRGLARKLQSKHDH